MHLRPSSRVGRAAHASVLLALCAAGCAPVPTGAEPAAPVTGIEVRIDERFYEVEGVTPWELNRALVRNGPRDDREGERTWYGETDFTLRYRYEPAPWAD